MNGSGSHGSRRDRSRNKSGVRSTVTARGDDSISERSILREEEGDGVIVSERGGGNLGSLGGILQTNTVTVEFEGRDSLTSSKKEGDKGVGVAV